jgi:uncharacterized protein YjbJ (UPF0337 family)
MKWNRVTGGWRQFQHRGRERRSDLTNDDLYRILGKHEPVIDKLTEPRGIENGEAEKQSKDFVRVNS